MEIQKWNKQGDIFKGILDPIYRQLDYCDLYYIEGKAFAILNHKPKYVPYLRMEISEIQDIFVLHEYRRCGLATALIGHCESKTDQNMIGISVPVSPRYGAAQSLYAKLGYIPDGNGVTYDRQMLDHNSSVKLDDDLCLMMVKELK